MQIHLTIRKKGEPQSQTIPCDLTDRVVFGRIITSPAHLEGSEISREHFALSLRQGAVYVEDLSANGTLVNNKPVPQSKPKRLGGGDVIGVPGYEIDVDLPEEPVPVAPSSQQSAAPPIAGKTLSPVARSFTAWEWIIIGSALASFTLIIYYIAR